jgi:hypothetical protein
MRTANEEHGPISRDIERSSRSGVVSSCIKSACCSEGIAHLISLKKMLMIMRQKIRTVSPYQISARARMEGAWEPSGAKGGRLTE